MWFHLRRYGAPRGRAPNEHMVPVGGTKMVVGSPDEDMKPYINTMSVVAALIATLTFAAAFTMPGGYDSSGEATLAKKAALWVFILSDALAMCCSITVVSLLWRAMVVEQDLQFVLINASVTLLHIALLATLVAFVSGLFAVIAAKALWVAILDFFVEEEIEQVIRRVEEEKQQQQLPAFSRDLYIHVGWPLYGKYGHASEVRMSTFLLRHVMLLSSQSLTHEVKEIGPDGKEEAMRKAEAAGNKDCPVKIKLVVPPSYVLNTQTLDKEQGIEILNKAIAACSGEIVCHKGKLTVKEAARAMNEREDKLLAEQMAKLTRENEEVRGDEDNEEEEDTGMGDVDLENSGTGITD
ncbi:hypothetical protein Vadar_010698 [Vaccinium darrowii]|uniref:Uncharacterized protein n=1 Tax=Vaccinium darrowii TaxID=229202 RepID=A0ACB7XGQ2_9ERIC|nr:hypothetical protein Vadar_010698 [Vaccinium darrowii]